MTIDDMKVGREYTIRYDEGHGPVDYAGCRFEGIAFVRFEDAPETEKRGASVYRAKSSPKLLVFWESRIVDIEED